MFFCSILFRIFLFKFGFGLAILFMPSVSLYTTRWFFFSLLFHVFVCTYICIALVVIINLFVSSLLDCAFQPLWARSLLRTCIKWTLLIFYYFTFFLYVLFCQSSFSPFLVVSFFRMFFFLCCFDGSAIVSVYKHAYTKFKFRHKIMCMYTCARVMLFLMCECYFLLIIHK